MPRDSRFLRLGVLGDEPGHSSLPGQGGLPVWPREVTSRRPQQTVTSVSEVTRLGAGTCPTHSPSNPSKRHGNRGPLGLGQAGLRAGFWLG